MLRSRMDLSSSSECGGKTGSASNTCGWARWGARCWALPAGGGQVGGGGSSRPACPKGGGMQCPAQDQQHIAQGHHPSTNPSMHCCRKHASKYSAKIQRTVRLAREGAPGTPQGLARCPPAPGHADHADSHRQRLPTSSCQPQCMDVLFRCAVLPALHHGLQCKCSSPPRLPSSATLARGPHAGAGEVLDHLRIPSSRTVPTRQRLPGKSDPWLCS